MAPSDDSSEYVPAPRCRVERVLRYEEVVMVGEGVQWVLGPCREMACSEAIDRSDERARGRPMLLRTMQQKKTPRSRSSDLAHEMHGKRDAV